MSIRPKSENGKIRVFLVDDHPLVREWLSQLIQRESDMEVCGEAEDAPVDQMTNVLPFRREAGA